MENIENTIVAFHIGRGGMFHNAGHVSFIGEYKIGHFIDDLFLNYENEKDFKKRYGFDSAHEWQRCILDLINDQEFDELEEKFGITEDMLGERIYMDGSGNGVGLTEAQEQTGTGRIENDGDYDTDYCQLLSECSEDEFQLILNYTGYVDPYMMDYVKKKLDITDEENEEE